VRRPKWKRVLGAGKRVYEGWRLGAWKIVFLAWIIEHVGRWVAK